MANDSYLPQLLAEKDTIDSTFVHASKLLSREIDRVKTGADVRQKFIEIHSDKPQKHAEKVLIPIKEFPKFNFVGKLLGPKGHTLKALQEQTGTKMSILGRGSMKDRQKEDELRKEGGKFAHLNEDLHILIEVFAPPPEAFQRIATALEEVKKFMMPEFNEEIQQQQYEQMMYMNNGEGGGGARGGRGGGPRGRGSSSGGRGGRGGAGRGASSAPPLGATPLLPSPMGSSSRGSPGASRGGMMSRGSSRGAPRGTPRGAPRGTPSRGGMSRGASAGRGAPVSHRPEPVAPSMMYEDDSYSYGSGGAAASTYQESAPSYSAGNGSSSFTEDTYADPYAESAQSYAGGAGGDTQYFDYGHGSGGSTARGAAGSGGGGGGGAGGGGGGGGGAAQSYDYGEPSWGGQSQASYGKTAGGGRPKTDYRQHPYSAPSRGGGGMQRY